MITLPDSTVNAPIPECHARTDPAKVALSLGIEEFQQMRVYQPARSVRAHDHTPCGCIRGRCFNLLRHNLESPGACRRTQTHRPAISAETCLVNRQITVFRGFDGHDRQTLAIGLREPLRAYIVPFSVIEPGSVIPGKIKFRFLAHLPCRKIRKTECSAVIVYPHLQSAGAKISEDNRKVSFVILVRNHRALAPKRLPLLIHTFLASFYGYSSHFRGIKHSGGISYFRPVNSQHSFCIKAVFKLAVRTCIYRKDNTLVR